MKKISQRIIQISLAFLLVIFLLPGCYESHYYHHNHHHSKEWYDHHHREYPKDVDFEIDVKR